MYVCRPICVINQNTTFRLMMADLPKSNSSLTIMIILHMTNFLTGQERKRGLLQVKGKIIYPKYYKPWTSLYIDSMAVQVVEVSNGGY